MPYRKIGTEELKKIKAWFKEGCKISKIADYFKVERGSIYYWLKKKVKKVKNPNKFKRPKKAAQSKTYEEILKDRAEKDPDYKEYKKGVNKKYLKYL